jgi:inorganic triphosphatase YgiF
MDATIEVELKLRSETEEPLRALALTARLGPATLGPASEAVELDRYLDTVDGRLAAAGWACRLRSRHGTTIVSLKGPPQHDHGDSLHRRPEVEGPASTDLAPDRWPSSPAREQLLELSGGGTLVERLALRQRRTEREAHIDGQRVGTLSLDRVQVEHRGATLGGFVAVELELDGVALGNGFDPAPLADALLTTRGLVHEPHTKLERALALLDSKHA